MPETRKQKESLSRDMDRRAFLRVAAGVVGTAALTPLRFAWGAEAEKRRPNVIFFLVDDMGWMDSTVYGSEYYDTPNLERLARRGVRFTDAYAANPLCSPTRASIMTGKYPARLGITTPEGHLPPRPDEALFPTEGPSHEKVLLPNSRRFLPLEEYTIAEAMRDAGYRTGFIGKWHMGQPEKYWPPAQGFDVNIGGGPWPGPPSYHSPYRISALPDGPPGEYMTDRLTDEALKYIEDNRGTPFFLCLWHYAVHAPFQHKEELTRQYVGRRDPRGKQNNPIMASMLKSMDESLGRVLDQLERLDIAEDTIIILFSDNGGNEYDRVGPERWLPTNNDPLRSGKGSIYEGGVRVPMLVSWPGVVEPGSHRSEVVSSIDFYPTILEMTGAAPRPDQILDGESLVPLLKHTGTLKREAIFCHMPHRIRPATGALNQPCTSVRKGTWKLIRFYETCEEFPNECELYDLAQDIGETTNLAEKRPDKVRELDALIDRFLEETNAAVPIPNPAYDPAALAQVDGWRPSRDCVLTRSTGALRIKSTGGDPFIYTHDVPGVEGGLTVRLRSRSTGAGEGFVFWGTDQAPQFARERRVPFSPTHDAQWREYEVRFVAERPLAALRVDPSSARGLIEFDWIELLAADGKAVRVWPFSVATSRASQTARYARRQP